MLLRVRLRRGCYTCASNPEPDPLPPGGALTPRCRRSVRRCQTLSAGTEQYVARIGADIGQTAADTGQALKK